ncbi:MAG: 50S ribosomal protein L6 [Opitutales bacterium]|nr:50S ribosomal protein L6 [Opitutales bacterium]
MSRIGKLPVEIPSSVKVNLTGNHVEVSGPHGSLKQDFGEGVVLSLADGALTVTPKDQSPHANAMHGTVRSIIHNMVTGVQTPYQKDLEIQGVGFKAALKGSVLDLSLGYSHPVNYAIPEGISVTVKDGTQINIKGADKALVGKVAAEIKHFYPVEPYKGKGVRIAGEHVRRKEGKKSAK